jgi:hypothetical protein
MSEKDSALRVMKAVADSYTLHRNLILDFNNGKPKTAVEHLVSVEWRVGSEHKAHGKMASLFSQPYISLPDYDTVEFRRRRRLYGQQSAVNEYERYKQNKETDCQGAPPQ